MLGVDWRSIEAKWRAKWQEGRDFEADPSDLEKRFITVAYPYPNSPQHIGHGRTYTIADVHARHCRMLGYNVLFPMGFHYTGTPILGMARRVESADPVLLDGLRRIYNVPDDIIRTFADPVRIADYFHEEIKHGMIEMGYSIDWRREFTTITPGYQKFIEWQIQALRKKNLIVQGSHPVGWCPKDQNPVSQHDTLGDVEPDFTEYTLVKFAFGDYTIPTATLRPETIFGVTNLWANPDTTYKKILVDGQKWLVSGQCARKLEFLDRTVQYVGDVVGSELVGKSAVMPHTNTMIPILDAGFVEPDTGTGFVMSVPAHAPFDYQALVDFKRNQPLGSEFQLIEPVSIISVEGYGEFPAKEVCERLGIRDQTDPRLADATTEVYEKEFYRGKLGSLCGKFAGCAVSESKDAVRQWLSENNHTDILLELTNSPVKCRCGAECVVKLLSNQWFLNYGDQSWKDLATKCLGRMSILPQDIVAEFHHVVGWLRQRACARQHGLGTRLPWDRDWIVESLSDSVIYMSYYVVSKFVNAGLVPAESLSGKFFDYVFLGYGSPGGIAGVRPDIAEQVRREFLYFYPVDSRHSGRDLVPNHLTFFVLNHTAIFPEHHWPGQIVVNGSVLMDGKKMSKSMGNIIPLRRAILDYGADPLRVAILISAELLQDADFNLESVGGIRTKLESMLRTCSKLRQGSVVMDNAEDRWIQSQLCGLITRVSASMEKMRLREALHNILFAFEDDIQWYERRAIAKGRTDHAAMLHKIYTARVLMLSPFAPHISEEMWQELGNKEMVSRSRWPQAPDKPDAPAVMSEDLLRSIISDIGNILRVTGMTANRITVYVADGTKRAAYHTILENVMSGQAGMGAIMKNLIADGRTADIKKDPAFVQQSIRDVLSAPVEIRNARLGAKNFDEKQFITDELESIAAAEFGAKISVFAEHDSEIRDPKDKARHARPFKPAILIE